MKRSIHLLILTALAACAGSDSATNPPPPLTAPASISITPSSPSVAPGGTRQLVAVVWDSNGTILAQAPVSWSVADTSLATVSATGLVSGKVVGSTTVTALSQPAAVVAPLSITTTPTVGLSLALSSYLGGSDNDVVRDVAVDGQGNVYLTGSTRSTDFPTTSGAYDETWNGGGQWLQDAFVAKLSPSGTLLWATYLGGPNYERGYAIELDPLGNVIVAGRAGAGFPVTAGALQTVHGGGTSGYGPQDGFVCKLTADGSTVIFCTYFGSSGDDFIRDMDVDQNGDIYIASAQGSGTLPAAWFSNAYQPSRNGGFDGLVAKIKGDGSQVLWATYLGGSGNEGGSPSLRVNSAGEAYFLTMTQSADMPRPGGFDQSLGGTTDLYLGKLSADGSQLLFGSFIGGSGLENSETHGLWLDDQERPVVAAHTTSSDFPTTAGVFQPNYGGGSGSDGDAFLMKLSTTGQLVASTYLGGSGADLAQGIAADQQGRLYLTGRTTSPVFPGTSAGDAQGLADAYALQLSGDLTQILSAHRYGGSGDDEGRAAVVDAAGHFHFVGSTLSTDWPRLNAFQTTLQGNREGFVAELAP